MTAPVATLSRCIVPGPDDGPSSHHAKPAEPLIVPRGSAPTGAYDVPVVERSTVPVTQSVVAKAVPEVANQGMAGAAS